MAKITSSYSISDHTVTVNGYTFYVEGEKQYINARNLKALTDAFTQSHHYLRLLKEGNTSAEPPLRVHIFSIGEYVKRNPDSDGMYVPNENKIELPNTFSRKTAVHEIEHAIDDFSYVEDKNSAYDTPYASNQNRHPIQRSFSDLCLTPDGFYRFETKYASILDQLTYVHKEKWQSLGGLIAGEYEVTEYRDNQFCDDRQQAVAESKYYTHFLARALPHQPFYFSAVFFAGEANPWEGVDLDDVFTGLSPNRLVGALELISDDFNLDRVPFVYQKAVQDHYADQVNRLLDDYCPEDKRTITRNIMRNNNIHPSLKIPFIPHELAALAQEENFDSIPELLELVKSRAGNDLLEQFAPSLLILEETWGDIVSDEVYVALLMGCQSIETIRQTLGNLRSRGRDTVVIRFLYDAKDYYNNEAIDLYCSDIVSDDYPKSVELLLTIFEITPYIADTFEQALEASSNPEEIQWFYDYAQDHYNEEVMLKMEMTQALCEGDWEQVVTNLDRIKKWDDSRKSGVLLKAKHDIRRMERGRVSVPSEVHLALDG